MPTYVYKFTDTGETIEVQQSFADDALTEAVHPATGDTMPVKKVFLPVGVTFKGDGFYKTDSRASKKAAKKSAESTPSGSSDSKSSGSSESKATGASESKSSGSSDSGSSGSSSSSTSSASSGSASSSGSSD